MGQQIPHMQKVAADSQQRILVGNWLCDKHSAPVVANPHGYIRGIEFTIGMMRSILRDPPGHYWVTKRLRQNAKTCCCLGDAVMHEIEARRVDMVDAMDKYVEKFGMGSLRP
jgi:hypothetical protein